MKRKVLLAPNLTVQQPSGNESLNLSSSSLPRQGGDDVNARPPLRTFGVGTVLGGMEANGVCILHIWCTPLEGIHRSRERHSITEACKVEGLCGT